VYSVKICVMSSTWTPEALVSLPAARSGSRVMARANLETAARPHGNTGHAKGLNIVAFVLLVLVCSPGARLLHRLCLVSGNNAFRRAARLSLAPLAVLCSLRSARSLSHKPSATSYRRSCLCCSLTTSSSSSSLSVDL
jgi:hypothetical protein